MVKIPGPLMSISAAGWLGGDTYGRTQWRPQGKVYPKGLLPSPYPIGLGSNILIPSGWTFGNHGNTYKIPRWGLRPYGPFISNYYSNLGWCYQRRRTWHGITYSAIRPPISKNKHTSKQTGKQWAFYSAVKAWQGFTQEEKDVYNKWRYPARASGFNRFIRWFLGVTESMPVYWENLQRSGVDPTLVQNAAVMQHTPHIHYPFQFYNFQAFNLVLHKGGGWPANPVAGQLFYRSDTDRIYKYDGAAWEELTTDSGLYTPTLYNETNIAASTAYQGMWARVGSLVIFSGTVAIDVTAAGAFVLGISVPVNSAFTDVGQASGVGNNLSSEVARVFANVVNANRIRLQGNTAVTTNYAWSYMMIYTIV